MGQKMIVLCLSFSGRLNNGDKNLTLCELYPEWQEYKRLHTNGMWLLFSGSFNKHLREVLGYDTSTAKDITAKAKVRYAKIISRLPEFEKEDRFKMNIVSCAMFSAFLSDGSILFFPDIEIPQVSFIFQCPAWGSISLI